MKIKSQKTFLIIKQILSDNPENIYLAEGMSITEDDCLPGDEVFSNDLKNQLEYLGVLAVSENDEQELGQYSHFIRKEVINGHERV